MGDPVPEQLTRAVVQDVRLFGAEHEQADDLTLLTGRWLGPGTDSRVHNHHAS